MDYIDFKNQIDSLRNQLQNFIDSWNRNAYTAEQSLEFHSNAVPGISESHINGESATGQALDWAALGH